jgi:iron complex outermembrane recepter protein
MAIGKSMRSGRGVGLGAALMGVAFVSSTALAQSALEEITVTASKRESSLQETPVAITAMTGEQLERSNVRNADDMASFVPGLEIGSTVGNLQIALRGVSNDSFFLAGDPAVAFHIDGVFRGRQTGGNAAFLDLERVEVLKGPQGTLYGRNATAGSINIITAKPKQHFEGYVEGLAGNFSHAGARGMVNVPIIEDKVAIRAAFLKEARDGFYENGPQVKENTGDVDDTAFRLHTLITPNDRLSILLSADYQGRGGVGDGTQILVGRDARVKDIEDPYRIHLNTLGERNDDFYTLSVETNYSFDSAKLTYLGAYHDSSVDIWMDYDRSDRQPFPLGVVVASQQQSHELRLASAGDDNTVDWLIGGYVFSEDAERATDIQINAALHSATIQPDFDVQSMAAFGQATWHVTDAVRVTGGLRYTKDDKSEDNTRAYRTLNGITTLTVAQYEHDWESWDWTFGADWFPVENTMLYAKVGTGFKSGGFNDPLLQGLADPVFKPEKMLAYQAGQKSRFLGGTLQVNSEAFYYDYSDLQINQLIGATNITSNAADARIMGVETEIVALPADNLHVSLGVGYLDSEFGTFHTFDVVTGQIADVSGSPLAKAPEWSVNAGMGYDFVLANQWRITPSVNFTYRSSNKLRIFNDPGTTQPAWTRTDVSVDIKSPNETLGVQLFANNLEDEVVWTNGGVNAAGVRVLNARPPLMYGVRLRYSFGE